MYPTVPVMLSALRLAACSSGAPPGPSGTLGAGLESVTIVSPLGAMSPGTCEQWGDCDPACAIQVSGNAFGRRAGAQGDLHGCFVGASHMSMIGLPHRDGMTAALGGGR